MAESRKNIKCSPEVFNQISNVKEELGVNWDELLRLGAESIRTVHIDEIDTEREETEGSEIEELTKQIEELRNTLPRNTADEIEERLR